MAAIGTRVIDVSIDEDLDGEVGSGPLREGWLRTVLERAMQAALLPGQPGQVSLLVTGDATVRELNRQYRGLDEVTDVLSFSTTHAGHWEGEEDLPDAGGGGAAYHQDQDFQDQDFDDFVFPGQEAPPLGEVIVSYPQAVRQAQERGVPLERELALLIVHGVLHLVGYDHLEAADTAEMQARERAALDMIFPPGTGC